MRDLSDSGLYFLSTQRAGLQLQGTLHAQVTGGERKKVKAWTYSIYKYLKNYNKKKSSVYLAWLIKKSNQGQFFRVEIRNCKSGVVDPHTLRGALAAQLLTDLELLVQTVRITPALYFISTLTLVWRKDCQICHNFLLRHTACLLFFSLDAVLPWVFLPL